MINLARFDPFTNLEELHERLRSFQESMDRTLGRRESAAAARGWAPLVDIYEDENGVVLQADLAGVSRDDIEIEVNGDVLTLSGLRKPVETEKRDYLRVERPYGPFRRSFNIGFPVDQANMKASLKDGVLEIVVPKAEESKPKRIEVEAL